METQATFIQKVHGEKEMARVAIMCNGIGAVFRGAERYTVELYNKMNEHHEVDIIGVKDTLTKDRNEIKIPWRNGRAYREAYLFGKHLYNHEMLKDYDIILNNSGPIGSYWCNKVRKRYGIPFITFERGGGREERVNNIFKPDLISYLTKYSYDMSAYKKKIHLPIGIDTEYKKTKEPSFIKKLKKPIVLSPSALVKFKRVDLTIDAFKDIDGTLVQTSTGDSFYVDYGECRLNEGFNYVGKVETSVLYQYFEHADLVVNASGHEAFGIVYLEAMKYNVPIVTQYDKRREEIIGDAGLLCDCSNEEEYSNKIKEALITDWGNKPRERALEYDWKKIIPKYYDAIDEVISRKQ